MLPGVLPIIRRASSPMAIILFVSRSMATTDGSFKTTPLPLIYTRILAVPRSIPMSLDIIILVFPPDLYSILLSFLFRASKTKIAPHIIQADYTDYYYIQFRSVFKGFFIFLLCLCFFYVRYILLSQIPPIIQVCYPKG